MLTAPGAGRDARLEPAIAGAHFVLATRADPPASEDDRDGYMWILPPPGRARPWRIGWVLDRGEAGLSHWALRHPLHQADFHDRNTFLKV